MPERQTGEGQADLLTLAALGVLAFVAETLLHEAGGHGSLCLVTGGKIVELAPLSMQCSVVTPQMVAAGPAMNLLVGLACLIGLRMRSAGTLAMFLWLSLVFNWMVAEGYLLIGALTGFGDWAVLFSGVHPALLWRVPAAAIALAAYMGTIALAGRTLTRLTGIEGPSRALLARLVLVPTGAAALVAIGAALAGGGQPLRLALAIGSTLFVGLTLMGLAGTSTAAIGACGLRVPFRAALVGLAVVVAGGFIVLVGPGANLSAL